VTTLRIAWRNLGRNRKRTLLALAAIAIGQYMLIIAQGVYHAYGDSVFEAVTGPLMGHVQIQNEKWREERAMDLTVPDVAAMTTALRVHPKVRDVWPRVIGPALAAGDTETGMAVVVGVDVVAEHARGGLLELVEESLLPGNKRVLVGRTLAEVLALKPGDELAVVGQTVDGFVANDLFTVAGTIATSVDMVHTRGVVLALEDAQALFEMPRAAHQIVVRGEDGMQAEQYAAAIASDGAFAGCEVVPWQKAAPLIARMIGVVDVAGYFVVGILFLAAISGITNTLMMSTFERTREFGMLLALGCGPKRVVRLIYAEAIVLGMLGVAVGTALGLLSVLAMGGGVDIMGVGDNADVALVGMQFPKLIYPRTEVMDVVTGVIAVGLTSLLAATWPARYAAKLEPMEAMRT
jgi:ABC-type lipoprotein release transport system permease subunit